MHEKKRGHKGWCFSTFIKPLISSPHFYLCTGCSLKTDLNFCLRKKLLKRDDCPSNFLPAWDIFPGKWLLLPVKVHVKMDPKWCFLSYTQGNRIWSTETMLSLALTAVRSSRQCWSDGAKVKVKIKSLRNKIQSLRGLYPWGTGKEVEKEGDNGCAWQRKAYN